MPLLQHQAQFDPNPALDRERCTLNSFSTCASCFISCLSWNVVMIGSWLDSAMYAGLASAR